MAFALLGLDSSIIASHDWGHYPGLPTEIPVMSKRAMAVAEDLERSAKAIVPPEAMEQRKQLAEMIRARMAKPATTMEKELWQEFKTEIEKERVTFRS